MEGEWNNGLCSHVCGGDCGTCMGAWFCTPNLYGRSDLRLRIFPDTNKERLPQFNSGCWLFCGAMCFHAGFVVAALKRIELRERFGIKGNACTDCLASYFCTPCTLAQMETELKDRANLLGGGALPPGVAPGADIKEGQYAPPAPAAGMQYQAPPPQY